MYFVSSGFNYSFLTETLKANETGVLAEEPAEKHVDWGWGGGLSLPFYTYRPKKMNRKTQLLLILFQYLTPATWLLRRTALVN